MKKTNARTLLSIGAWLLMGCAIGAPQDIVPGALWQDNNRVPINAHGGGLLVHEGQIYWFGEHKIQGRGGNKAQVGVHCYSSPDLTNWTDQGINPENNLGPEKTFGGQSTFVLPVPGKKDAFIAMFDMWRPRNPIDGRYLWLPIQFTETGPSIPWQSPWNVTSLAP